MNRLISILLTFAIVSAFASPSARGEEVADTVIHLDHPEKVVVQTDGGKVSVEVKGYSKGEVYNYDYLSELGTDDEGDWEVNLPFTKSYWEKSPRRSRCRLSVDWFDNFIVGGVLTTDAPAGTRGGWEIGVDNLIGVFWHTGRCAPVFSLGFGMGYKSTNFGKGMVLGQEGKRLVVVPVGEEGVSASSRLHLFRLSIPFMITQPLGGDVKLRVGAILQLNTYTSATTKIKAGRYTGKESFHSLEQRFATPDILGSVAFCDNVGVYVRWSPVSLFSQEWGPEFKTVSIGVSFVM